MPVKDSCTLCAGGSYQDESGKTECKPCEQGSYCPERAAAALPCEGGSYTSATDITTASECVDCPAGHACSTAVSDAADAEPFRDSDAVLSGFTNLDNDVLIVAQKGKLGYNNPLVKLILNLHCHSRTLESRNAQMQGLAREIRILRREDAWLEAVARRHGFWEAVLAYITPLLERNEHQVATLFELDAHYNSNQANIRQWLAEQGASEALQSCSKRP